MDVEEIDHVKEQRRSKDQAVDAVEHAAVAGDACAHVLDADVALDDADDQIAELAADAHDQAGEESWSGPKWGKEKRSSQGRAMETASRTERAVPGLFRG